jgi:hypothetical protein
MKEYEIGEAYKTHFQSEIQKKRSHFEDLGVDGVVTSK